MVVTVTLLTTMMILAIVVYILDCILDIILLNISMVALIIFQTFIDY